VSLAGGHIDGFRIAFGGLLATLLLALAASDLRAMILPDRLNVMLAGIGLGQSLLLGLPELRDAALGSMIGGGLLGGLAALFRRLRGSDGLGLGDVKLVGAAGLWVGWQGMPLLLSVASTTALAFVALRAAAQGRLERTARLPFGPFLAVGTVASWLSLALP
jgi:leader peptidase (prepilin peptidase) / N-methyltransferase